MDILLRQPSECNSADSGATRRTSLAAADCRAPPCQGTSAFLRQHSCVSIHASADAASAHASAHAYIQVYMHQHAAVRLVLKRLYGQHIPRPSGILLDVDPVRVQTRFCHLRGCSRASFAPIASTGSTCIACIPQFLWPLHL